MSLLSAPWGPDAVKDYRFWSAPLDQTRYDGELGRPLVKWLQEHGLQWDGYWTNGWQKTAQAVAGIMRDAGVPVIMDVDDHFEGVGTGNQSHVSWRGENISLYKMALAEADRRVASTPFLADRHNAKLAPNFVWPAQWDYPTRSKRNDDIVLLHCGSVNRSEDYIERKDAFRAFLDLPNTKIVFMGWLPAWVREYPVGKVVFCRWTDYGKYRRMLRWLDPDILVSPMEHHDFNLAKSNIKWLEAAMCHACFVGERWGEYERTVEDGVTGVLADGHEEWAEKLRNLALDTDSRREIAKKGYDEVVSMWTWEAVGPLWKAAVGGEEVANGSGSEWIAGGVHGERGAAATS